MSRGSRAAPHPDSQDVEISAGKRHLLAQRRVAVAHPRERLAQVVDQRADHRRAGRRIVRGQVLDVGQRVVEKMRLDLRPQHLQPCIEQAPLQLRLVPRFAFAREQRLHARSDGVGDRIDVATVARAHVDRRQHGVQPRVDDDRRMRCRLRDDRQRHSPAGRASSSRC